MFKLCCIVAVIGVALAAPLDDPHAPTTTTTHRPHIEILESGSDHKEDGSYSFHYRGEDGTFREETAVVKNAGTEDEYLEVNGSYSFFDSDGKEVVVNYKADNHGFVPEGSNIPDEISLAAKHNSEQQGPVPDHEHHLQHQHQDQHQHEEQGHQN